MKYRFKPSEPKLRIKEKKPYRRAGRNSPRRLYGYRMDDIDLAMLFEIAKLEEATDKKRRGKRAHMGRGVLPKIRRAVGMFGRATASFFYRVGERVALWWSGFRERRRARPAGPDMIPTLVGALTAVLLVGAFSAFAVIYKLFLSNYFGSYERVSVPDLVGMRYSQISLEDGLYNVNVSYRYSDSAPEGEVISQYPEGGVVRKIFRHGSPCTLNITVSQGRRITVMPSLAGLSLRDASLALKNAGAVLRVERVLSEDVPRDTVISSEPRENESFYSGQSITLYVSDGARIEYVRVPNVCGLSENSAAAVLVGSGLLAGEVSYRRSSYPAGTVIAQSVMAGSELQRGETVSFTVSAGYQFNEKTVPSLYGMTVEEAKEELGRYGLLCGNIYTVSSSEPRGTVVAQSPKADSAISTSDLTVDIYVSS